MKSSKEKTISCLASPFRLFFSLLLIIFGIETLIMFVLLPLLFGGVEGILANIADATLLTLLTAPYLWMRIVRPLRNAAQKEAAWTKTILENVVDGVVILDKEGVVESLNAAAETIFGYSISEVKGLEMKNLIPEEKCFSGSGEKSYNNSYETVGHRKDGSFFPVDLSISKVCAGDQCMFICIMRNVTERKRVEEEIRELNEELETRVQKRTQQLQDAQEELLRKEKLAILGQLSGSVGHELRNPLGVMSNAVYFLKMVLTDADDTTKEYLDIFKKEIDNSLQIITDLLDFARTRTPQTKAVTARELTDESLGRCVIPENIDLQTEIPDNLPLLMVDTLQMGQVLTNFITNAIQAMPGGGVLRVAARRVLNSEFSVMSSDSKSEIHNSKFDGDFVEISVADTGEGIAPENTEKLFQPLFTTKAKGLGLGLVVCKNLVEANGGRLGVESEPGEETTFMVMLPTEMSKT